MFSSPLARLVEGPGYGRAITFACISIPLAAFSSIQSSLYRRDFDFKMLFGARLIGVLTPLLVTTPLAFFLRNFWALVISTIVQNLMLAVYLTLKSPWKPRLYYSWKQLKQMLGFSMWTVFESVSIWLTGYADLFIVGTFLSQHYLGIYRTSMATVGGIVGIVTAATTPVLFASLSRLQDDREEFRRMFFRFQKIVGMLVVPIGFGIFVFGDVVTAVMLGRQWGEAVGFIGLWGLVSTVTILFSHYASEVYRSLGRPRLSALAQWLHIVVLVPVVYVFAQQGFGKLYVARSLVRLETVLVNSMLLHVCCGISSGKMLKNVFPAFAAGTIMALAGFALRLLTQSLGWNLLFILLCAVLYFALLSLFPTEKEQQLLRIKNHVVARYVRYGKK